MLKTLFIKAKISNSDRHSQTQIKKEDKIYL